MNTPPEQPPKPILPLEWNSSKRTVCDRINFLTEVVADSTAMILDLHNRLQQLEKKEN